MSDSNNHLYKGDDFGRNFLNSPVATAGLIGDSLLSRLNSQRIMITRKPEQKLILSNGRRLNSLINNIS